MIRDANPLLRPADPAESRQIATLSRLHIEHGLNWRWTPARVRKQVLDPETMVLVATVAGELRGFAIMRFGDTQAHLLLLAVEPKSQHRGIGRALLEWLELSVSTAGLQNVRVEVRASNTRAQDFYHSLGYQTIKQIDGYYDQRESAIVLLKEFGTPGTS